MFDISSLTDMVSTIQLIDENNPIDSTAMLPFVGAPFSYHQFRQGRSNWPTTIASLGLGLVVTEGTFFIAGKSAGFTSMEWFLARGASALGIRYGGRSLLAAAFLPGGTTAGASWGVPMWFNAVLMYEFSMWYDRKYFGYYESRTSSSIKSAQRAEFG
jgi:hypothetical protein